MAHIVFSHGNSFPGGTYSALFRSLRARGCSVHPIDRFGHDPRYPVTSNWPHLVQQLADTAAAEIARHGQPVWLVGHSLGGFLSLMCAAKHPQLGGHGVAGVIMLDSPVLGGWRAKALALAKHTQLVGSLSPGKISRARRHQWPSADEALAHFQHKKAFARWDPQVLRDYIEHGTEDADTPKGRQRVLRFDRDIETTIYNTLPHNLDRLLRRHPLPCPVAFVGGTESEEMRQVGMGMTRKVVGPHPERLRMIEGSHLFPMERPLETAQTVTELIQGMQNNKLK
jgi:pimeloyl-ACP methyl ester carboxylesterase